MEGEKIFEEELTIGTRKGCLKIIGELGDYQEEIEKEISKLDDETRRKISSLRRVHPSPIKPKFLLRTVSLYPEKKYKCQCKCGQIHYLSKHFFELKRHSDCGIGCGLIKIREQKRKDACPRLKADGYDVDYTNTIFESLEILECVDDNVEEFYLPKRGKGICTVFKLYRCRCYLCGMEQNVKSSDFKIYNDDYGSKAKDGYYSQTYCDCHNISSFQWRTVKILQEYNIKYRVEYSFPDLYGVAQTKLLRFDFAIFDSENKIKCLIECQGEQHYKSVEKFGGNTQYKVQVKNDNLKRLYAEKRKIQLLEIPYTCNTYEKEIGYLKKHGII